MFFVPPDLVELLRHRATYQPDEIAFTFLVDGEDQQVHITNAELDRQARAIGGWLQSAGLEGERALLLYPPGLEFIAAFFGCLYAGVVAVPVYPPRKNRSLQRIQAIAEDAQARVALTTQAVIRRVEPLIDETPHLKQLRWLATCDVPLQMEDRWQKPPITSETLAFLQYTSGSTGMPKGVMLNHGNLLHNSALIAYVFEHTRSGIGVFWLPSYHDMGLIGGILQPLFVGRPNILMSPLAFLQKPFRWLWAITRFRATTSGGPNFAYELCVDKIPPAQRAQLDLSSWQVAFNGAEPVRAETMERFTEAFAPYGFRREAFFPCYGLAEATLIVTGGYAKQPPVIRWFLTDALERGRAIPAPEHGPGARPLVGCGQTLPDQRVLIVDPDTCQQLAEGHVGEIWVQGPSVAMGYWNRPEATAQTFGGYVRDTGEGPFLRTGDLGFLHQGELFVTGRIKDVIILRGRNIYPQDIELTVQHAHPWLRPDAGAAFTVEQEGRERLVIVHEVERRARGHLEPVLQAIRKAISEEHDLAVDAIVLIKPGTIPKTSSNKIQRHACRQGYLDRTLAALAWWERAETEPAFSAEGPIGEDYAAVGIENCALTAAARHTPGRKAIAYPQAAGSAPTECSPADRSPLSPLSASEAPRLSDGAGPAFKFQPASEAGSPPGGNSSGDGKQQNQREDGHPAAVGRKETQALEKQETWSGNGRDLEELVLQHARRLLRHRAEEISLDTAISELGLDSMQRMELITALEGQLGGRLPLEILPELETFRDVVHAIERYLLRRQVKPPLSPRPLGQTNQPESWPEYTRLAERLKLLQAAGLAWWHQPVLDGEILPQCRIGSRDVVNFLTGDYLGLGRDPTVKEKIAQALERWGSCSGGSGRSGGRRPAHSQLEIRLANYLGVNSALVVSSELAAWTAIFAGILSPADWVLHESGYPRWYLTAALAAGATVEEFPREDLSQLEERLGNQRGRFRRVWVAIQAIYPVEATVAPLPELLDLKRRFGLILVVDQTHSLGTLGATGRGIAEYYAVSPEEIDLMVGSLGTSLAAGGAYLAGTKPLVEIARHGTTPAAQEVALSPVLVAGALAALEELEARPQLVGKLHGNSRLLRQLFAEEGFEVLGSADVPLVPVVAGNSVQAIQLAQALFERGILALPVGHPTVRDDRARIRFTCTAPHSENHLRKAVEIFASLRKAGALSSGAPRNSSATE